MRLLFSAILCLTLAGVAPAQRRGGGFSGGGMRGGSSGGGMRGGSSGFNGGHYGGGFSGGGHYGGASYGGHYGGYSGFRGYNGYGRYGAYLGYGSAYYGNWGFGLGFGYGYGYGYPYVGSYPYLGGYYADYGYPYAYGYAASPAVSVVYAPQPQTPPIYVAAAPPERANPITREYDQFGQEIRSGGTAAAQPASSPIYLFAFQDNVIRAASSYRVEGKTLHYTTLQHEEKQAPLASLDRALTLELNRERQVTLSLP